MPQILPHSTITTPIQHHLHMVSVLCLAFKFFIKKERYRSVNLAEYEHMMEILYLCFQYAAQQPGKGQTA